MAYLKLSKRIIKLYHEEPHKLHRNIFTIVRKSCPQCRAPSLHYCMTSKGNVVHKPHVSREYN